MGRFFQTGVLAVSLLFCGYTAWASATAPAVFAERLGLKIVSAGGTNEIRAQYAGFFLAAAIVCAAALAGVVNRPAALVLLTAVFGGLVVGRLVSLAINGGFAGFEPTIKALYLIDFTGLALAVAGLLADRAG